MPRPASQPVNCRWSLPYARAVYGLMVPNQPANPSPGETAGRDGPDRQDIGAGRHDRQPAGGTDTGCRSVPGLGSCRRVLSYSASPNQDERQGQERDPTGPKVEVEWHVISDAVDD